jgi:hypothetical protein
MSSVLELEREARDLGRLSREIGRKVHDLELPANDRARVPEATPRMKRVSLRVLALCGENAVPAVEYLRVQGRRAEVTEVQSWYTSLTENDRQGLLSPLEAQPGAHRELAEARKFVGEKDLVTWIQELNKNKRIAPTPGAVLDLGPSSAGFQGKRRSRYRRLKRVIARWGGRKAVFGFGDQLSREVLDQKVRRRFGGPAGTQFALFSGLLWRPQCGPILRPLFASFTWSPGNYSRQGGPDLGPKPILLVHVS